MKRNAGSCDTYLLQSNLLPYLARLDPTEHHFLGLTEVIDDVPFPQGGSVSSQSSR